MQWKTAPKRKPKVTEEVTRSLGFLTTEEIEEMEDYGKVSDADLAQCDRWRQEGCDLAEAGNFEQAIILWKKAVSINPQDHRLFELKAQGYLALDQVSQALQCAQQAVQLAPEWVDGIQSLARCQREIGEVILSLESYRKAQRLDPLNSEIGAELLEVQALADQLEAKRRVYLEKLEKCSTEDEAEVCRCFYNLSTRSPPTSQST